MDMKPILNRGTGKRLQGGALLRAEMNRNEWTRRESLRQKILGCTFSREVRTIAWNRMDLHSNCDEKQWATKDRVEWSRTDLCRVASVTI